MEESWLVKHSPFPRWLSTFSIVFPFPDRYGSENRSFSNKSIDSTRYSSKPPEARNMVFNALMQQSAAAAAAAAAAGGANRNSLIDAINSNRSSMDVSTCSYNTLIIHNDDNMFAPTSGGNMDGGGGLGQDKNNKKDRLRREYEQGMQEITEIPDDYLNQSHVLKHLAKEMKIPQTATNKRSSLEANDGIPIYKQWIMEEQAGRINNKLKSKSQPELTR